MSIHKERSLEEWIEFHNSKVPYPFKHDERYKLLYRPNKGFLEIGISGNMVIGKAMCGDVHFWRAVVEGLARECNLKLCGAGFCRKILPYIRLLGFRIDKVEETSNGKKYYCTDKKTGQRAECSPACIMPNGILAYLVTWRVNADEDKI